MDDLSAMLERLADLARRSVLRYFRQPVDVLSKDDESPVTIADRETERLLIEAIGERYPDHRIFGEESGGSLDASHKLWVIDPIDGTKSFVIGRPTFGCLVAYIENHQPIAGVIEMPALGERWIGRRGEPTRHNGTPVAVSGCRQLDAARLCTTSPDMFSESHYRWFRAVSRGSRFTVYGGDCYSYGLLASGTVDLVIEEDLGPYDYMALIAVVEGAGGVISDWNGQPLTVNGDGRVIAAASAQLHAAALALLGG